MVATAIVLLSGDQDANMLAKVPGSSGLIELSSSEQTMPKTMLASQIKTNPILGTRPCHLRSYIFDLLR